MSRLKKLNNNKNNRMVYERTREEHEPAKNPGLIYFFIIFLLGGFGYLIFFSGALKTKNIDVIGYSHPDIIREVVRNHQENSIFGDNILFFDSARLADVIKGDSGVRSVKVERALPNTLKIIIEESTGAVVWNTAGESFVIDERGYVIEKNNIEGLPQVFDNANIATALGERVASPTFINYIIDLYQNFEPVTGHKIAQIIILDIFSDVHVKSNSGWTVYLDSSKDPVSQLENLNKVLRAAQESGRKTIEYIDMRLDNKVYYK